MVTMISAAERLAGKVEFYQVIFRNNAMLKIPTIEILPNFHCRINKKPLKEPVQSYRHFRKELSF